jgi:hypothetical protein
MKRMDLTGQRFGRLRVEGMSWDAVPTRALCICDCGSCVTVAASRLRNGTTTSCGCWQREASSQRRRAQSQDLTGQRFGRLLVENMAPHPKTNRIQAICRCDCGRQKPVRVVRLVHGTTRSCGCLEQEMHQARRLDLVGQRFGRLIVNRMEWAYRTTWAVCQCDCGNEARVKASPLKQGETNSCGCWHRDQTSKAHREDLTGQRFDRLIVQRMDWSQASTRAWCLCECGQEKWVRAAQLKNGDTRSCGCLHQEHLRSFGQKRRTSTEEKAHTRRLLRYARAARKRGLPDTFDRAAAIFLHDYWGDRCAVCGASADFWHVIAWDHWIPLAHATCPGTTPGNILPLCHGRKGSGTLPGPRPCNNSKRHSDPIVWLTKRFGSRQAKGKLRAIETYFVAARAAALLSGTAA